jgi:hypothetical protein
MKKLIQTRTGKRGNCYPTVVACILDKESPEDVIQIQEIYKTDARWWEKFIMWIAREGYVIYQLDGHSDREDEFYLVHGKTKRFPEGNIRHVCIYQNGKLFHDPHPDQSGLITEEFFEVIKKFN